MHIVYRERRRYELSMSWLLWFRGITLWFGVPGQVVKKLVTTGSDLDFLSCLFMSCYRSLPSLVAVLSSFSCGSLGRTKYCVSWKLNSFSFSGVAAQSLFDPSRLISLIAVVDWWSWSSLYILVGGVIFGRYVDMV